MLVAIYDVWGGGEGVGGGTVLFSFPPPVVRQRSDQDEDDFAEPKPKSAADIYKQLRSRTARVASLRPAAFCV